MHAAGIDLGKETIHICTTSADIPARAWTVHIVHYKDDDWPDQVRAIIPPGAPVVAEPTGGNLIAPLAAVLRHYAPLYLVNHQTSGHIRHEHISRTKSDPNDARALALAASWIDTPAQPRSARPYNHADADTRAALRLYIDNHRRLTKQRTAATNRLESIAFSIWPALAHQREMWQECIRHGVLLPDDVLVLADDPPPHWHWQTRAAVERLAARLPEGLFVHPARAQAAAGYAAEIETATAALDINTQAVQALIQAPPFDKLAAIWATVPGSGTISVASLCAALHGPIEDYTLSQFRAAIGTNPQGKSSGKSSRSKQTRSGYKPAAAQIHLWTMTLIRLDNNPISAYFKRTQSDHPLAAARNKLAAILWTIATQKETYRA